MPRLPWRAGALFAAACAALVLPSTSAADVTLGTQTDDLSTFSAIARTGGNIFATLEDPRPGHVVTAPTSGVITSWRTNEFSGTVTAALVILRRTPATDNMRLVAVGRPVTALSSWFGGPERLQVAAGDQIGVVILSQGFSYFFWGQDVVGARYAYYDGLTPGGPALPPSESSPGVPRVTQDAVFQARASLEPDADNDGWGDETQDTCPAVAGDDQTDTDGDGAGNPCDADDDGDGLADADETTRGTNTLVSDTDGDGVTDGGEVARGLNPLAADSDGDGLADGAELAVGTDPLVADTDLDGVADGADACPKLAGADGGCAQAADAAPLLQFLAPSDGGVAAAGSTVEVVLGATDDRGVASVDVIAGGTTRCALTAPPYVCRFPAGAELVGRRTIVAVARDAAGNEALATRVLRVSRFAAERVTAEPSVTRSRRAVRFTTTGAVRLPEGLDRALGCEGRVTVQVKRGRKTLSSRGAKLDSACEYTSSVTFRSRVRARDRLRVVVRFDGNRVMGRSVATARAVTVRAIPAASRGAGAGPARRRGGA